MVFKNKDWLYPEFLPDIVFHREKEMKILAENIKTSVNSFIYGSPGIGKTLVAKFVMREAFENLNLKNIYINCWQNKTTYSILTKILLDLNIFVPPKGLNVSELFQRLENFVINKNIDLIICLDEVDMCEEDLLYLLSRLEKRINFILITNREEFLERVDGRIRSSLLLDKIYFKPYSLLEIKDIIEYRLKKTFKNYEEGISLYLAGIVNKFNSDIRVALKILLKAGSIAENSLSDTLKISHVKKVVEEENLINPRKEIIIQNLNEEKKEILNLLKENKLSSKEILEKIKYKVSERTLQRYLKELIELNLVKFERIKERGKIIKYYANI